VSIQVYVIHGEAGMVPEDLVPSAKEKEAGIGTEVAMSEADGKVLLAALRKGGADGKLEIQAAPSVVTRSGQRAKVEMVREFIYPTEYDPPEIPGNLDIEEFQKNTKSGGVFPVTPANPTAFEMRSVGLTFEYDPTVMPGRRILLQMVFEDVRFNGFVNYGSPIKTSVKKDKGRNIEVILTENRILMPVFSVRKMTSSVELENGGWLLLGGLSEREEEELEREAGKGLVNGAEEPDPEVEGPIFFLINVNLEEWPGS
jgi:Flp pilus assembly secretin CpaC